MKKRAFGDWFLTFVIGIMLSVMLGIFAPSCAHNGSSDMPVSGVVGGGFDGEMILDVNGKEVAIHLDTGVVSNDGEGAVRVKKISAKANVDVMVGGLAHNVEATFVGKHVDEWDNCLMFSYKYGPVTVKGFVPGFDCEPGVVVEQSKDAGQPEKKQVEPTGEVLLE